MRKKIALKQFTYDELKGMDSKKILTGKVMATLSVKTKEGRKTALRIESLNAKVLVLPEEIGEEKFKPEVYVGRVVVFTVIGFDEATKTIYASIKRARDAVYYPMVKRLQLGELIMGQIINILPFGAYIEMNGVIGLMRNTDFSTDTTAIGDLYSEGDYIPVKMLGYSKTGQLRVKPIKKVHSASSISLEEINKGQVVIGVVREVKPFGVVVNIGEYADVLCQTIPGEVYSEDTRVHIRIDAITPRYFEGIKTKNLKGTILKQA